MCLPIPQDMKDDDTIWNKDFEAKAYLTPNGRLVLYVGSRNTDKRGSLFFLDPENDLVVQQEISMDFVFFYHPWEFLPHPILSDWIIMRSNRHSILFIHAPTLQCWRVPRVGLQHEDIAWNSAGDALVVPGRSRTNMIAVHFDLFQQGVSLVNHHGIRYRRTFCDLVAPLHSFPHGNMNVLRVGHTTISGHYPPQFPLKNYQKKKYVYFRRLLLFVNRLIMWHDIYITDSLNKSQVSVMGCYVKPIHKTTRINMILQMILN